MITNEQLFRINEVDRVCRYCIRAIHYWGVPSPVQTPYWLTFMGRCFGEIAIIQWCHVFNSYSNKTHYTKVFSDPAISDIALCFDVDAVLSRLLKAVDLTLDQYDQFREEMKTFRDNIAAHWDPSTLNLIFPDLHIAERLCLELRCILAELVNSISHPEDPARLSELKTELDAHGNSNFLAELDHDTRQIRMMRFEYSEGRTTN